MAEGKHLTLEQRICIESMLKGRSTLSEIAACLGKSLSTISREIRARSVYKRTGSMGGNYNACALRSQCRKSHICSPCHAGYRHKLCRRCTMCNTFCGDFREEKCPALSKPPYVCNGCAARVRCTLKKRFYDAGTADRAYRCMLSESRSGISLSEEEVRRLDEVVTPLIRKKQSPYHICTTNKDEIMVSQRTVYRYIDARILSAMNLDLQRKVRFSARKKTVHVKVDKKCRIGRTFDDFTSYMDEHPDTPVVELDTVEGKKGGRCLLTIHFKKAEMMLAFLRDHNDSKSVIEVFCGLYERLSADTFRKIFVVCLADNGSEFSNPSAIEMDGSGQARTRVFYCEPSAPYQKGSAERNHEFIRLFIPKGTDMAPYTQEDISLMMDHINSYGRAGLGDRSPYDMFAFLYGEEVLRLLGCRRIPPQDITLGPSVFRKEKRDEV